MKKRLLDIKTYFSKGGIYDYKEINSWSGQILVNEDNTFEGIALNATTSYDCLVTGIIKDDQTISILKLNLPGYHPHIFYGFSNGKELVGDVSVTTPYKTLPYGSCKILLGSSSKEESFQQELEQRIMDFKNEMDDSSAYTYQNYIAHLNEVEDAFNSILTTEENRKKVEAVEKIVIKKLDYTTKINN